MVTENEYVKGWRAGYRDYPFLETKPEPSSLGDLRLIERMGAMTSFCYRTAPCADETNRRGLYSPASFGSEFAAYLEGLRKNFRRAVVSGL